jgi:hypothetical protein
VFVTTSTESASKSVRIGSIQSVERALKSPSKREHIDTRTAACVRTKRREQTGGRVKKLDFLTQLLAATWAKAGTAEASDWIAIVLADIVTQENVCANEALFPQKCRRA